MVCFQGKLFNITVIQVHAPTTNAEEGEVEWFYEDLQEFLEKKKLITEIKDSLEKIKVVQNAVLGCNLNNRMISVRFQGKPISQ